MDRPIKVMITDGNFVKFLIIDGITSLQDILDEINESRIGEIPFTGFKNKCLHDNLYQYRHNGWMENDNLVLKLVTDSTKLYQQFGYRGPIEETFPNRTRRINLEFADFFIKQICKGPS